MTLEERRAASKLYELLYKGANIYNAPSSYGKGDAMTRFVNVVREMKPFMKDLM